MVVRRNSVVPAATQAEPERGIHRCHSCGVGLARWPRQYICSWCKGDPGHGRDGYFNDIIDDMLAGPCKGQPRAVVRDMLNADRSAGA